MKNTVTAKQLLSAICILSLIAMIASCKKDNSGPSFSDGTLQFTVHDSVVNVLNLLAPIGQSVVCEKQLQAATGTSTRYRFTAATGYGTVLIFSVPTDSLKVGDYTADVNSVRTTGAPYNVLLNKTNSGILLGDDNMHIHISSYSQGYISGTFTGKLSPTEAQGDITLQGTTVITNGTFKSVQCLF